MEEARKLRSEFLQVLRSRRWGEGAEDPPCPLAGPEVPKSKACKAYADAHAVYNFKLIARPGIRHRMTPLMVTEARDWFDQFLKQ